MVTAGVCGVLGWWDVAGSFISRRTESVHLSVLGWDTSETAATRPGSGPGGSESAEGSGGLLLDRILSILGVGKCPHYNYVSGMNRASGQTRCRTRAVNEPSAKFSQSQRRPLLGTDVFKNQNLC